MPDDWWANAIKAGTITVDKTLFPRVSAASGTITYPSAVSQPSTSGTSARIAKPTADGSYGLFEAKDDDFLNPPDGAYPFIELGDLTTRQKEQIALARLGIDNMTIATRPQEAVTAAMDRVRAAAIQMSESMSEFQKVCDGIGKKFQQQVDDIIARKDEVQAGMAKAAPHHLLASESQRARAMFEQGKRKVSFNERVCAWTCVSGDYLARGGDMITGCTINDAQEVIDTDAYGNQRQRWVAWVVNT